MSVVITRFDGLEKVQKPRRRTALAGRVRSPMPWRTSATLATVCASTGGAVRPLSCKILRDRGYVRLRDHLKPLSGKQNLSHNFLADRDHIQTAPVSQNFVR